MTGTLRKGIAGVLLIAGWVPIAAAQAVVFDGPPEIGDRRVEWSWEPVAGRDPYFQGNTILERVADLSPPIPGPIRMVRANPLATALYLVAGADDRIYRIDAASGSLLETLPAPPAALLDLEVHGSDQILLGGLADGRVAIWDRRPDAPEEIRVEEAQNGACRHARFFLLSNDPDEQRFVTGGDEDSVRVWTRPGRLARAIATAGQPAVSLDLTDGGTLLAVGGTAGGIRLYEPTLGTILRRLDLHTSPVVQLLFSTDQRRLVSLDAQGKLVVWGTAAWQPLIETTVENLDGLFFAIRQPDAQLVYTLDREGLLQIVDGQDARLYRSRDLVEEGPLSAAAFSVTGRGIFLGLPTGAVRVYRTGFCIPSIEDPICFGGYKIWRSTTPFEEDAALLRIFGFGDSTWAFHGPERRFVDPDSMIPRGAPGVIGPLPGPHNGMPYYYSVTAFERRYLNGAVFDVHLDPIQDGFYRSDPDGLPTPVRAHEPGRSQMPLLGGVTVVPNPYEAGKVPWDRELGEHVEFRNLPTRASIRIYTMAGDHLRTIEHGGGDFGESTDSRSWDLKNAQGERVASGVYIYRVTTPLNNESTSGYCIVVR